MRSASSLRSFDASPTTKLIPKPFARVLRTAIVWGATPLSAKKVRFLPFDPVNAMTMPSAAAVASSKRDALAISIAVNDITIVWKLTNDSRRPRIAIEVVRMAQEDYETSPHTLGDLRLVRRIRCVPRGALHDLMMTAARSGSTLAIGRLNGRTFRKMTGGTTALW